MTPNDGSFVSQGGLPTRITQPEAGPLTRAVSLQSRVQQELGELRGEMGTLTTGLGQVEVTLNLLRQHSAPGLTAPLGQMREVAVRVARVSALLGELDQALGGASDTIGALRMERGRLQALYVIAEHLNATLDRAELLQRALDDLLQLVGAERGGILLADTTGGLTFEAARAAHKQPLRRSEYTPEMSRGAIETVWQTQRPLLTADARHDARVADQSNDRAGGIRAIMCAPLRADDRSLGVVYVDQASEDRPFTDDHLDLLAAFCNIAAIAIQNVEYVQRLATQMHEIKAINSYTDSILNSLGSGVLALDNSGRVTRANAASARILGQSVQALLGRVYDQVLDVLPDDGPIRQIQASAQDADVTQFALVHGPLGGQGRAVTINVGWSALCNPDGRRLGTVIVLDDLTELATMRRESEIFRRYVQPDVVDRVTRDPAGTDLGGETRDISVVFTDIRGFTKLSEELDPQVLVRLLNDYLGIVTERVLAHGGTVTMFQGDAVMAIFNAPHDQADHPWLAVQTAWEVGIAIDRYNQKTGNRTVEWGIGVHTGPALVGNIGAEGRLLHYTAIGDTVNVAQRLEEHADRSIILLSDELHARVAPAVTARRIDDFQAKGKSQLLRAWHLTALH